MTTNSGSNAQGFRASILAAAAAAGRVDRAIKGAPR